MRHEHKKISSVTDPLFWDFFFLICISVLEDLTKNDPKKKKYISIYIYIYIYIYI